MAIDRKSVPSVSVSYAQSGASTKANAYGMRAMQERAYEKRGEQYLLIKSPPASGKPVHDPTLPLDANPYLKTLHGDIK